MIVELKEIPVSMREKRATQRSMMRKDLAFMFENNVHYAEIKGDYNFKNLSAYLREEARSYFTELVRCDNEVLNLTNTQRCEVRRNYKGINEAAGNIFKINQHKAEDGIHVYVECNADLFPEEIKKLVHDAIHAEEIAAKRRAERVQR